MKLTKIAANFVYGGSESENANECNILDFSKKSNKYHNDNNNTPQTKKNCVVDTAGRNQLGGGGGIFNASSRISRVNQKRRKSQ